MNSSLTVIYVVGAGRSGSTIFDRVLGTYSNAISLNQIYPLGEPERHHCGCGHDLSDCPFWQDVMQASQVFPERSDALLHLREKLDHTKYMPLLWTDWGRSRLGPDLDTYLSMLRDVYMSIKAASGRSVLVDSSKVASRALLLNMIPDIDVHAVHLVRDLRGVTYSWSKKKKRKGGYLSGPGMLNVIKFWAVNNLAAEALKFKMPYTFARYEDFCTDPRGTVDFVANQIPAVQDATNKFIDKSVVDLGVTHSISGNPDRFDNGPTRIQLDEAWKQKMSDASELTCRVLGYPLLRRYRFV